MKNNSCEWFEEHNEACSRPKINGQTPGGVKLSYV